MSPVQDDAAHWDHLEGLMEAALALPAEDREPFLDAAGGVAGALRDELLSLISCAARAESFFNGLAGVVDAAADSLGGELTSAESPSDDSFSANAEVDPLLGQTVGPYQIEERLGEGGMGVVYRAYDTRLQRAVALKFLPPELNADRHAKERFLLEARAAAALDHPNICAIHEVGDSEGPGPFIAMAYYPGETLAQTLKNGPLPWRTAVEYAAQIARGLVAAHDRGIVHRDVKPANVVVTADGVVKLLDFGIARMPRVAPVSDTPHGSLTDVSLTRTGRAPGTSAYMSPEQVAGRPIEARTDLWSLGVLLHEMCTGVRPFHGQGAALHESILHARPEPPSATRPDIPQCVDDISNRLLEKDPSSRYANAAELLGGLTVALQSDPVGEAGTARLVATRRAGPRTGTHRGRWANRPALLSARRAVAVMVALFCLAIAWWAIPYVTRASSSAGAARVKPVIAVLPITTTSDRPEEKTLAGAMHAQLIADLETVESLVVIDRRALNEFRTSSRRRAEVAAALGAQNVVEASLGVADGRVRIDAALYDAADVRIWSESFEQEYTDVLKLSAEVARAVATRLAAGLAPGDSRLADRASIDTAALTLYMHGRSVYDHATYELQVSPDSQRVLLRRAAHLFARAAETDTAFALAWAYLARAQDWLGGRSPERQADTLYALAREAADRAIQLDSSESIAWSALGWTLFRMWKFAEAEAALERGRALSPTSWNLALGHFYLTAGRHDAAIRAFEQALLRDSRSLIVRRDLGEALACAGRVEKALQYLNPALFPPQMGPAFGTARARTFLRRQQYADAVDDFESYVRARARPGPPPPLMAYAYRMNGNLERAREIVFQRGAAGVRDLADDLAAGDTAALLKRLQTMVDTRDRTLLGGSGNLALRCWEIRDELLAIPKARALIDQLGLPGPPIASRASSDQ